MNQTYCSYVYKVTSEITGQYYYGSRFSNVSNNRHPSDDLWIYYFTSSKLIEELIKTYGPDSFIREILFENVNYDEVYWHEQSLIKTFINEPLNCNGTYVDKDKGHKMFSNYGDDHPMKNPEIAKKVSIAKKGKFNSNGHLGMRYSEETKKKLKLAQQNNTYRHSNEMKEHLRLMSSRPENIARLQKLAESKKNSRWCTNGTIEKMLHHLPSGWNYGRLSKRKLK